MTVGMFLFSALWGAVAAVMGGLAMCVYLKHKRQA